MRQAGHRTGRWARRSGLLTGGAQRAALPEQPNGACNPLALPSPHLTPRRTRAARGCAAAPAAQRRGSFPSRWRRCQSGRGRTARWAGTAAQAGGGRCSKGWAALVGRRRLQAGRQAGRPDTAGSGEQGGTQGRCSAIRQAGPAGKHSGRSGRSRCSTCDWMGEGCWKVRVACSSAADRPAGMRDGSEEGRGGAAVSPRRACSSNPTPWLLATPPLGARPTVAMLVRPCRV